MLGIEKSKPSDCMYYALLYPLLIPLLGFSFVEAKYLINYYFTKMGWVLFPRNSPRVFNFLPQINKNPLPFKKGPWFD